LQAERVALRASIEAYRQPAYRQRALRAWLPWALAALVFAAGFWWWLGLSQAVEGNGLTFVKELQVWPIREPPVSCVAGDLLQQPELDEVLDQ
jgi:hypothetical protein